MIHSKNVQLLSSLFDKEKKTKFELIITGIYNFSGKEFSEYQIEKENIDFEIIKNEINLNFPLKIKNEEISNENNEFYNFKGNEDIKIEVIYDKEETLELKKNIILEKECFLNFTLLKKYNFDPEKITKKQKKLKEQEIDIKIPLNDFKNPKIDFFEKEIELNFQIENDEEEKENKKLNKKKTNFIEPKQDQKFHIKTKVKISSPLIITKDPLKNLDIYETQKFSKNHEIKKILKKFIFLLKDSIMILCKDYAKTVGSSGTNYDDLKKFNAFTEQQQLKMINTKKINYIRDFFNTKKFKNFQKRFNNIVEKLFYDSLIKNYVILEKEEIRKNITIVNFQIKKIFEFTIQKYFEKFENIIPIEMKYFNNYKKKEKKKLREFFEESEEMFYSKVKEYEKIGYFYLSEKFLKEKVLKNQNNKESWYNLSIFYLRRQNFNQAESCLNKVFFLNTAPGISLKRLKACFFLNRKRFRDAKNLILENLVEDKWSLLDNLLMAFVQEDFKDKKLLARKYFNIAKRKYISVMSKNINTGSSTKINEELEEIDDEIWKKLVIYLTKNCFVDLVYIILNKISEDSFYKNFVLGNIESIKKNYKKSNNYLQKIIDTEQNINHPENLNPFILEAIANKACNSYFLENHYESEFKFLQYLKKISKMSKNTKKQIYNILLILAYSYLKRGAYTEASSIFKKLKSLNPKSVLIWIGIAITSLNANKLEETEEALSNASKISPHCSEIWGYFVLLNFKKFKNGIINLEYLYKVFDIYFCQEIENLVLLEVIGNEFKGIGDDRFRDRCFERIFRSYGFFKGLMVNKDLDVKKFMIYDL